MTSVALADVLAAREGMKDVLEASPCSRSPALSRMLGCEVYLKLENLHQTGSFKERGAFHRLSALTPEERARGVIAASAGNHAQGVAFHAARLGVPATIVMPRNTPLVKVTATTELGAHVVLHGPSYDDAAAEARRLSAESGAVLVSAFDDDWIIAGQGTCGLEILEQVPDVEAIVVPVGGGGLVGGIGVAVKGTRPEVCIYGVEPARVPSMAAALEAGAPVELPPTATLADGVNVRCVSERTLALARGYVDGFVTVEEEEIAEAVLLLLERTKTVAEGAGAIALAGVASGRLPVAGKRVVVVVSGGNIDVNVVSRIIDRGLVKSGRLLRVRVTLPDTPGQLAALLGVVAEQQANVLQIHQDGIAARPALGELRVDLVLETRGFGHVESVRHALLGRGFELD